MIFRAFTLMSLALLLLCGQAQAQQFTGFTVVEILGDCQYKVGDAEYQDVKKGETYAFGTLVKTGRSSQMDLELSPGNTFRVLARSRLEVTQDGKDRNLMRLQVKAGSVEVKLDEFPKGQKLQVETPTAVCGAVGTRFNVSFEYSADEKDQDKMAGSRSNRFSCDKGEVFVSSRFQIKNNAAQGDTFNVPSVKEGSALVAVVHQGLENSYTDITVNRGSLTFDYGNGAESNRLKVQATEEEPTRFVCALDNSTKGVDTTAIAVKSGTVQSEQVKRFLFNTKVEDTPITPDDGAVVLAKQEVYVHNQGKAVVDYIAAAQEEGELHSKWVDALAAGDATAPDLEAKTREAAAKATRLRKQLLNRRVLRSLRQLRQGQLRPPRRP